MAHRDFDFDDTSREAVARRVRAIRARAELGQASLADLLGTTRDVVAKWEQGRSRPTLEHLRLMARRFSVTTDFLIFGDLRGLSHHDQIGLLRAAEAADAKGDARAE